MRNVDPRFAGNDTLPHRVSRKSSVGMVPDGRGVRTITTDAFHDRFLAIVLKLPGAYEDRPWGSVHGKVDGKIFVGWGRMDNREMSIGLRVNIDEQVELVEHDPRFSVAKYVGRYGGMDMHIGPERDWREIEGYIVGSYRMIASKKRVKELDAMGVSSSVKPVTKKPPARARPAAKKTARGGSTKKSAGRS